jgi:hypothetical protein
MNIYRISQDDNCGYDTYDSMIVSAKSKKKAQRMIPCGQHPHDWANTVDGVEVEYIGKARKGQRDNAIILASFNAG